MHRERRQRPFRRLAGIGLLLGCVALLSDAQALDYRFGYHNSYRYPYSGFGTHENLRLRREVYDLGDKVQRQQRQLDEQIRLQQEQNRVLRQQRSTGQQFTARQACYYRFDGGLDLCDRLFDGKSKKHAACVDTVKEINPGCAEEVAGPTSQVGG